jgi:hypothetical protein
VCCRSASATICKTPASKSHRQRQAEQHRHQRRDVRGAAKEFEALEIDEQIDGEADRAQRRPGEIERDEGQEQREIERLAGSRAGVQQHCAETSECGGGAQENIEQSDRAGIARGALVAAAVKMRRAQIDESNLGQPEIGDPQRIADRRSEDEDREQLRIEHAREHEEDSEISRAPAICGGANCGTMASGSGSIGACMVWLPSGPRQRAKAKRDNGRQWVTRA